MKTQVLLCSTLIALSSMPTFAGETKLDVRFGHNTASDIRDSRVKFMHTFDTGFYFSAEAAQIHNDGYFAGNDSNDEDEKKNMPIIFDNARGLVAVMEYVYYHKHSSTPVRVQLGESTDEQRALFNQYSRAKARKAANQ